MSNLVTPIGRLCFPALFEARAAVAKATPKFSATILLDKQGEGVAEFMRKVRMTIQKVIGLRWPDPKSRPEQLKLGVKDGDTLRFTTGVHAGKLKKEKYPEYGGCWAIQASRETAKGAPGV
ncbi:MAG: ssDNA-binding protein, partial [Anaerolineales bacterium]